MRRRILCTVLVLLFVLTACQGPAADSTDPPSGAPSAGQTDTASRPVGASTPEPTPTPEPPVEYYIRDAADRSHYILVESAQPDDGVQYYIADPEDDSRYLAVELVDKGGDGNYGYELVIPAPTLTDEQVFSILKETMLEGYSGIAVSVGVIQDGAVTASGAWGWAVLNEREMTAGTKLRVASLSKVAVGLCAMAMAEDGLLELDAPLSTYWGEDIRNPYSQGQPSAYTLMTHTSSIMDRPIQGGLSNLRGLLRSSWLSREPGNGGYWYYNNFGFCVLGTTLELAAGKTLDEYFQSRYLEPMGIRASLFSGNMDADELACLYNIFGGVERSTAAQASQTVPTGIGDGASYFPGGLTISAPDLAKLVAILANDGVYDGVRYLSAESVADMETPRFAVDYLDDTWPFEQCLVIRHQEDLMGRDNIYYHTGSAYGVYNLLSYDPDTGDGVVVLTIGASGQKNERGLYALCAELSVRLYAAMEDLT